MDATQKGCLGDDVVQFPVHVRTLGRNQVSREERREDKAKVTGWLKTVTSYRFPLLAHFYLDVISEVSTISLVFQRDDIAVSSVLETVESAIHGVKSYAVNDGTNLKTFLAEVSVAGEVKEYKGQPLKDKEGGEKTRGQVVLNVLKRN